MFKKNNLLNFGLLLIYSLLPGIYKIVDNQMVMAFSIPVIFMLFFCKGLSIVLKKIDLLFLLFLFYISFLCIIQYFTPNTNRIGLFMGIFLDIIPMAGFFYSRKLLFENFAQILIPIGIIHLVIGIFLYPLFGLGEIFGDMTSILREGVSIGRMSSVSGSLGFASLMFMVSMCALYYRKKYFFILLIGVICAAQRSGWLACALGCFFYCIADLKKGNFSSIKKWVIGSFSFIILLSYVTVKMDIDVSYFMERFDDIDKATGERSGQWTAGINNFLSMPIGTGSGQVGQVAARYEEGIYYVVPDGDYFRVLSEFGFAGALFYIVFLLLFLFSCCSISESYSMKRNCLLSLFCGINIQMIGSNITEFYFTNFLYWTFMGYIFLEFNLLFVSKNNLIK
nr:O-antigen ligase family protein [Bacteroides intestinalis]